MSLLPRGCSIRAGERAYEIKDDNGQAIGNIFDPADAKLAVILSHH